MLDIHCRFFIVGLPGELLPGFSTMSLLGNGAFLDGSHTSPKKGSLQML
jgi:hypothetical protein